MFTINYILFKININPNFVALILVYLCTNPNNRGIDKIACVK